MWGSEYGKLTFPNYFYFKIENSETRITVASEQDLSESNQVKVHDLGIPTSNSILWILSVQ